ncbi:hypothetical protein [Haliscomenobacter sp.]|uniref:vWA domain-containing protein n=1 Tax=Haliscomenobacter sp. TaxID=2717303 RepID=UPI0035944DE5
MKKATSILISMLLASIAFAKEPTPADSISKIQLCLILDVSGSMDGLLSQAQNEIWKTISFVEGFQKEDLKTVIEIAVISYGNHQYAENGHVKLVVDFNDDVDEVAEKLWLMEIGGGNEFSGSAIKKALDSLSWEDKAIFKCIIMAGNEPFDQGIVNFEESILLAIQKGIILNTIYCGEKGKGIYEKWEKAAKLGNGIYANIDQGIATDEFKTPYDHTLIKFYFDYKSTYSDEKKEEKIKQFDSKGEVSPAFRDMIIYRYGRMKKAKDIIDKFNESNWEINQFDDSEIPEKWRNLSPKELKFKLLEFSRKRETYAEGFETYTKKVEEFLKITVQPKLNNKTLNLAMSEMMSKQLIEFGYVKK